MFRPIRMDHTNCLQVAIKTHHPDQVGINFHRDTRHPDKLWGWVDVDWEGDVETHHSHTGFVLMMNGGPISWKSCRQVQWFCPLRKQNT